MYSTHNARAFDAQFILRELAEHSSKVLPSVILRGQNIITIEYGRTKFIDSYNYFQMKLSKLPATFGLPESSKKGYFPHLLNTVEIQDYVSVMPDSFFYSPNTMSEIEHEKFFNLYNENAENYNFEFKKEIVT